jgi:rubrerythrin
MEFLYKKISQFPIQAYTQNLMTDIQIEIDQYIDDEDLERQEYVGVLCAFLEHLKGRKLDDSNVLAKEDLHKHEFKYVAPISHYRDEWECVTCGMHKVTDTTPRSQW